jgi:betaine-aldehyde dehydrogenase
MIDISDTKSARYGYVNTKMKRMKKLFYAGKYQDATSGQTFATYNPANGQKIDDVQSASAEDVERAVQAAKKGFQVWSKMAPVERSRILMKAAALLREKNEEIANLEVMDTGKPIAEAIAVDVLSGADAIEFFAGIAPAIHGRHYDLGNTFAFTRREPLGICAGIGAWNYPIQIACWKSAPALACGNSMIFKPAELTPLTALQLAEVYREAGLPEGVFNVVQGGPEVGEMLTRHPEIAKISLTGEVTTGKKVMSAAASTLKQVTLELGGKSPILIFADADLDEAVNGAMLGNFYTQGEVCSNGTRVYVQKTIKKEFLKRLVEKTKRLIIGDPADERTEVGALISEDHLKKVLFYIDVGKREGAKLLCGGGRHAFPAGNPLNQGYFVDPTIFEVEDENARIVREEIFGPVMAVLPFETEEEVIAKANDTPYGLSAGVFTNDLKRAHRVVNQLQAGVCWINNYNVTPVQVPFGGYKQSGIGRENGLATIEHYTQLKTVYVEMGRIDSPYR